MDREMIARHLALAEEHVRFGEEHLASQRAVVANLETTGGQTLDTARDVLTTFESTQRSHVDDRARLRRELAEV
jgi:hypothetical protein